MDAYLLIHHCLHKVCHLAIIIALGHLQQERRERIVE